jgi:hypothetical protein
MSNVSIREFLLWRISSPGSLGKNGYSIGGSAEFMKYLEIQRSWWNIHA